MPAYRKGSMRVLDLFSGTGSVARVFRRHGHEVLSLDRDMDADIKTDIMDWDYREYAPESFDFIWASPPCTEYSRAKTTGLRQIDEANRIVERTLEILAYLNPKVWVLENPQTGLLKHQVFMTDLPFVDVDYCKYGMPYRKRTRLWTNAAQQMQLRPLCSYDCGSLDDSGRKHRATAQRVQNRYEQGSGHRFEQGDLYKIPELLIEDIVQSVGG